MLVSRYRWLATLGFAFSLACGNDGTSSPSNQKPVANAGRDQSVDTGSSVTLDGSRSTDLDNELITYRWSFLAVPPTSAAVLSDATIARPTFTADVDGVYSAQLVVNDGKVDSDPNVVEVTAARANKKPVANAGENRGFALGSTVTLDGAASSDADGDTLTFSWAFISVPDGSTASLATPGAAQSSFVADREGSYVVRLTVSDGRASSSTDVTITVFGTNNKPVANAGAAQTVPIAAAVTLDGSASSDADGDPLQYGWSFVSVPSGSLAVLTGADTANPTFTADLAGEYVVQLVVGDGKEPSQPSSVVITASNGPLSVCSTETDALLCDSLAGSSTGSVRGGAFVGEQGWKSPGQIAWDVGVDLVEGAFAADLDNWNPASNSPQHRHGKEHILNMYQMPHGSAHAADDDQTGYFNVRCGSNYNGLFKFLASVSGYDDRIETRTSPPNGRIDPSVTHTVRVEWNRGGSISAFVDGSRVMTQNHGRTFHLRYVFIGTDNSGAEYGPMDGVIFKNVRVWGTTSGGTAVAKTLE